jgi:hypothetical protein
MLKSEHRPQPVKLAVTEASDQADEAWASKGYTSENIQKKGGAVLHPYHTPTHRRAALQLLTQQTVLHGNGVAQQLI